mmetsp:Transcript_10882/g.25497  ORF Transcript_10882/g.25497 Transcript_10882/m.25497 type:complete len:300 (-) Transcript_10882:34-933(-)
MKKSLAVVAMAPICVLTNSLLSVMPLKSSKPKESRRLVYIPLFVLGSPDIPIAMSRNVKTMTCVKSRHPPTDNSVSNSRRLYRFSRWRRCLKRMWPLANSWMRSAALSLSCSGFSIASHCFVFWRWRAVTSTSFCRWFRIVTLPPPGPPPPGPRTFFSSCFFFMAIAAAAAMLAYPSLCHSNPWRRRRNTTQPKRCLCSPLVSPFDPNQHNTHCIQSLRGVETQGVTCSREGKGLSFGKDEEGATCLSASLNHGSTPRQLPLFAQNLSLSLARQNRSSGTESKDTSASTPSPVDGGKKD